MRRAGHLGDGWIPSFITPEQFRIGVDKTLTFAAEAGREVPGDHFRVARELLPRPRPGGGPRARAPFIPRGRADAPTLEACTAFGPAELVAERLEQYVRGGGSSSCYVRCARRTDARSARAARGRGAAGVSRPLRDLRGSGAGAPGPRFPESTTPRAPRAGPRACRVSTAAAPTAPVGSTMMRARSARKRTAATISASLTSATPVRFRRRIGNVSSPVIAGGSVGDRGRRGNGHALALLERQVRIVRGVGLDANDRDAAVTGSALPCCSRP